MRDSRKKQKQKYNKFYVPEKQAWSLFSYQAEYIAAGLRTFIHMKRYGLPSSILEAVRLKHNIASEAEFYDMEDWRKEDGIEEEAEKEWEDILKKMYHSFDEISNDHPDDPLEAFMEAEEKRMKEAGLPTYETKELPNGSVEFKSHIHIPEEVWEEEKKYNDEIQEGLRLYAKYFTDLWD